METIKYDVFLSRKSEDAHLAKEIYNFLTEKGLKVFYSDHSLQEMGNADYIRAIDDALINTANLIVVMDSVENIEPSWFEDYYRFLAFRKSFKELNCIFIAISIFQYASIDTYFFDKIIEIAYSDMPSVIKDTLLKDKNKKVLLLIDYTFPKKKIVKHNIIQDRLYIDNERHRFHKIDIEKK